MAIGKRNQPPSFIWQGAEYPLVRPADYQAVFVRFQGPELVFAYSRWSLRLEFCLLSENVNVSAFINMGHDKGGPQTGGPRSNFFAVWSMANGGMPRKGQKMTLETFSEPGLIYLVRVADARIDGKNDPKPDALVYSRVTKVLGVNFK